MHLYPPCGPHRRTNRKPKRGQEEPQTERFTRSRTVPTNSTNPKRLFAMTTELSVVSCGRRERRRFCFRTQRTTEGDRMRLTSGMFVPYWTGQVYVQAELVRRLRWLSEEQAQWIVRLPNGRVARALTWEHPQEHRFPGKETGCEDSPDPEAKE